MSSEIVGYFVILISLFLDNDPGRPNSITVDASPVDEVKLGEKNVT